MGTAEERDLDRCICTRCPTFVQGDVRLFCLRGKSGKQAEERGCLCRTCPVHIEGGLEGREYCVRGKPEQQ